MTQPEPTVDPDLPPGARQRLFSPVTATLICGHRDAILVDALLTLDQARRLAGWIAAHGKNLTSVYITHAHGDHWFGLSAILDRYPAARALTLPAALDQMHRLNTPEIVAAFWETRFPRKLPDKLMFPEPLASQILELEGVRVASGKFWSDIAGQRLCASGGRLLVVATTVRTGLSVHSGVVAVAARMFSEEQLEQLRSFPDIGRDDLIRYFTLTRADVGFVDPGRGRGPADRLGLAVQLCALPWLGFVPDEVSSAPPVARLAERLGLDPGVPEGYGRRSHTRSRARRTVLQRRSLGRARPRRPLPGRRRTPAPGRTTAGSVPARPPGITPPFSVSTQRRTLSMCGCHGGRLAPRCGAERRLHALGVGLAESLTVIWSRASLRGGAPGSGVPLGRPGRAGVSRRARCGLS